MLTETDALPFQPNVGSTSDTELSSSPGGFRTYTQEVTTRVIVEPKIDVKKFSERTHLVQDKYEYPRDGKDPGLVLIFNQETFDHEPIKSRRGSRRDVNEIILCLQRQGFNIEEENIMTDGTRDEILNKLGQVCEQDLSEVNCLILFFLTHGEEFNRLHTKDGTITTNEIWNFFSDCKQLNNKPKMFVFQACKGEGYSTTGNMVESSVCAKPSHIAPLNTFKRAFIGPDMLIVYSTVEGKFSFREVQTGTWFIQELCKNVYSYGKKDDAISLIIRTTKCVCGNYFLYKTEDGVHRKQMPMFMSTLRKKFYLNRNKDRDLLLRVIDTNEKLLKEMAEIKECVKELLKDEEKRKKK